MSSEKPTSKVRTEDEIREWLIENVASRMNLDPASLKLDESLVAHGIDSMQFVVLVGELEDWLGCRFSSNPLVDHPSINELAKYLASEVQAGKLKTRW